ncbi:MAG: hypothetical protein ACP5T6_03115, partial [Candidatus Micrarchaeia archaeon]
MLFFNNFRKNNKSYSGSESYKYIDKLLEESPAKIKIITPFISDYYARKLKELAKKKKIYLIISGGKNAEQINKDAIRTLTGKSIKLKTTLLGISTLYFAAILLLRNILSLFLIEYIVVVYIIVISIVMLYSFFIELSKFRSNN